MSTFQWAVLGLMGLGIGWMLLVRRGDVSPEDARRLVGEGALLLDVRTVAEFSSGHLPNAMNVPLGELDAKLRELGAKDRAIVVYCLSGTRSAMAKRALERAGFQKVVNLGAMSRW